MAASSREEQLSGRGGLKEGGVVLGTISSQGNGGEREKGELKQPTRKILNIEEKS